jgi:hypothetical protein
MWWFSPHSASITLNTINLQTILYRVDLTTAREGIVKPCLNGLEDIQDRLLKLEKQNRWLKQLGAAALMVSASLIVMGQAPSKKTVEANEFLLRDRSNNVRARLSIHEPLDIPSMELFDEKGRPSVELSGGLTSTGRSEGVQGGGMILYDSQGHERGSFLVSDTAAYLRLSDVKGSLKTAVSEQAMIVEDGAFIARSQGKDMSAIIGGGIKVSDGQGFEATLGTTDLVTPRTGESHKTSAASLVMFDKDKNVIWKAP